MECSNHPGKAHRFSDSDCKSCTLYNMHTDLEAASIEISVAYFLSVGETVNLGLMLNSWSDDSAMPQQNAKVFSILLHG